MYMQVALAAISIGVILFIGYLLISQVKVLMPTNAQINDTNFTNSVASTQVIILSGFGLVAVGIIVVAAFGLINIFK